MERFIVANFTIGSFDFVTFKIQYGEIYRFL